MSAEALQRTPMSLEEFHRLPEGVRAEYVDGVAIVTPPPRMRHNHVGFQLARLLDDCLPDLRVVYEVGLEINPRRFRIPDLAVVEQVTDTHWTTQVPHLVVEILSPSTRNEDVFRKALDYRSFGIEQYWIVDPDARTLTVLQDKGEGWDIALELTADRPTGSVLVGEHGTVRLDLAALLST